MIDDRLAIPKTKTYLTPAEYAVLGLVRRRPAYGYELQRYLSGNHGLARVCPVEPAMVYAILKSLSGLELIDGEWDSSSYPPKAVYTITDSGYAAFERWRRSPVGRMREVRQDFLIKLYFALLEDVRLAQSLLAAQIDATRDYAAAIAREQAELSPDQAFDAIVLGSKASAARITREWLEECLADLSRDGASSRAEQEEGAKT